MKIVIISDTHGEHAKLGRLSGDVLIHCGDFALGDVDQAAVLSDLDRWFAAQDFRHVICVGGNHDFLVEEKKIRGEQVFRHAICLEDEGLEIDGFTFFGAPWVPELRQWAHFLTPSELQRAWERIPENLDVLITHTPPRGILDRSSRGKACGCELLGARLASVPPRLHCFGHIHASAGTEQIGETRFVNASMVNSRYEVSREPTVISLERRPTRP